jgi:hypothetical protein
MKNVKRPDILLNGEVSRVNCFLRKGSFIYTAVAIILVSYCLDTNRRVRLYWLCIGAVQSPIKTVCYWRLRTRYFPFQHQQTKIFIVCPLGKQLYPTYSYDITKCFPKMLTSTEEHVFVIRLVKVELMPSSFCTRPHKPQRGTLWTWNQATIWIGLLENPADSPVIIEQLN